MKKSLISLAIGLAVSTTASAGLMNDMYINLSDNTYDTGGGSFTDANTLTGIFTQFGFNQILATSVYSVDQNGFTGSFFDTNISSELQAISPSPTEPSYSQTMIGGLKPLAPPLNSDNEGFLNTWDLTFQYHFDGTLLGSGPSYTGGYIDFYFNDYDANTSTKVLGLTLTGSKLSIGNLDLYFDLSFAANDFLFIETPGGQFIDAASLASVYGAQEFILDTNVDPPVPTLSQMTFAQLNNQAVAYRQTTLDGSISANVPEPASLALAGIGLLGIGLARRRKLST